MLRAGMVAAACMAPWLGPSFAWAVICDTNYNVGAAQTYATIQQAVDAVPATLSDNPCVVIRDASTFAEQVSVRHKNNNGFTLTIMKDPALAANPVVSPPAGSTAAFLIQNASVTVLGIDIVPAIPIAYGIKASSAYVTLSSISLTGGANLWGTGVAISSRSSIAYLTIAVGNANGIELEGEFSSLSFTSSTVNPPINPRVALWLNGASSTTIVSSSFVDNYQSLSGVGVRFLDSHGNNILDTRIVTSNGVALRMHNSSSNTVVSSTVSCPVEPGEGALLTDSHYNRFLASRIHGWYYSLYIDSSNFNRIEHSWLPNTDGNAIRVLGQGNRVENSVMTGYLETVSLRGSSNAIVDSRLSNNRFGEAVQINGNANIVLRSTVTSSPAGDFPTLSVIGQSNSIQDSYIAGSTGIILSGSTATTISGNLIIATAAQNSAVFGDGLTSLMLVGNRIEARNGAAVSITRNLGSIALASNTIRSSGYGIRASTDAGGGWWISSNTIMGPLSSGIDGYGLYLEGLQSGATIYNNAIVYRQAGGSAGRSYYGLYARSARGLKFSNNRINQPGMAGAGSFVGVHFDDVRASEFKFNDVNSTASATLESAYLMRLVGSTVTIRNNIFFSSVAVSVSSASLLADAVSGFDSDYNDWFSSNALNTIQWGAQTAQFSSGWLGKDANSVSANPLWFNASAGVEDFHPLSMVGRYQPATGSFTADLRNSPSIDAADPGEPVGAESAPNGSRANQGSYGGTLEASRSCGGIFPPTISLVSGSSFSLTASWGATCPPDAGFILQASTAADFTGSLATASTADGSATALTVTSLSPSVTYHVRLDAVNLGLDNYSNTVTTATAAALPHPLSFTNIGLNQFTANWPANNNPSGTLYEVEVSTDINFGLLAASSRTASLSFTPTGLNANTIFFVRARAFNVAGSPSDYARGAAATAVGIITISANRLSGIWYNDAVSVFNAQGAVNYHYRVSASPTDSAAASDPIFDGSALPVSMLQGVSYFHVLGVNGSGASMGTASFGPIQVDTASPVIAAVFAQKSSFDSSPIIDGGSTFSSSPHFFWQAPSSISPIVGYSALLSQDASAQPALVVNTGNVFYDSTLSQSGSYYFKVRALNQAGTWGAARGMSLSFASVPGADGMVVKSNYFNPVRGECMGVELQVATAGRVKMDLYTLLGRKVSTLAD
ncbi:MAG: right-handed parallel beta-helix repeat-containing protein, partial [Elusimicrobia bacterium]|nr:right-handed parallel beta-helix repeat-containing protein [Elusimicrobiota bacterium]